MDGRGVGLSSHQRCVLIGLDGLGVRNGNNLQVSRSVEEKNPLVSKAKPSCFCECGNDSHHNCNL